MKKLKAHLVVTIALLLFITITGCGSGSASKSFNEATLKLRESDSHTIRMTLSIKTDYEKDTNDPIYKDSNVVRTLDAKYQTPETPGANFLEGSKLSVFSNTSRDGSIERFYFYVKDDVLYAQRPDQSNDFLYVSLDSPDYKKVATPATSLTALDFLISDLTTDNVKTKSESILIDNIKTSAQSYNVTLSESKILDLASLFAATLNTNIENENDLINSLDIDSIEYIAFIDKKDNIVKFEIRFTVSMPSPANDSSSVKTTVYINAAIRDVNSTTVEYPDLSNAISYSDAN